MSDSELMAWQLVFWLCVLCGFLIWENNSYGRLIDSQNALLREVVTALEKSDAP